MEYTPILPAGRTFPDMLSELRRIVTLPECIAVGEIGIDMATACDCRQPYSRSACRMALLYSQMDLLYVLLVLSMETKKSCRFTLLGVAKLVMQAIKMFDGGPSVPLILLHRVSVRGRGVVGEFAVLHFWDISKTLNRKECSGCRPFHPS